MHRIPRLTARFFYRRQKLGATHGAIGSAVSATIGALARGPLPGAADYESMMPPVVRVWVRRVPGFNLWILYGFGDAHVTIVSLAASPPVPIDE